MPLPTSKRVSKRTKKKGKKKGKKGGRKTAIHEDLQLAGGNSPMQQARRGSTKLVSQEERRSSLRRMSVEFMSEDVKRMTMLAASMQAAKDDSKRRREQKSIHDKQRQLENETSKVNEFHIRRTMVHRAIKRLRQEERSKHRQWITKILEPNEVDDPHGVLDEINRMKNTVSMTNDELFEGDSGDDDDDPFNIAGGPVTPTSKSFADVVKKKVAITNISRKLHRKIARPSWYSEYQEAYNYEHRVQKDGFEYIFDYHAHFGNTIKSFFPTAVMDKDRVHEGMQCAFVSLDKTGFNYWEVLSSENSSNLTNEWSKPVTKRRTPFRRRENEFIQALCWNPNLQL